MEKVQIFVNTSGYIKDNINEWIKDNNPQIIRVLQSVDEHGYMYISLWYQDNDANKQKQPLRGPQEDFNITNIQL